MPQGAVQQDVGRPPTMIQKQLLLREEHLGGSAVGRSTDEFSGYRDDPVQHSRVEMIKQAEGFVPQEALDVLDSRFDLTLRLCPVWMAKPRPEDAIDAELPEVVSCVSYSLYLSA